MISLLTFCSLGLNIAYVFLIFQMGLFCFVLFFHPAILLQEIHFFFPYLIAKLSEGEPMHNQS